MSPEQIREVIAETLAGIAPEADLDTLGPGEPLRETLDLDSMDFLALIRGLHERLGVDVPESEYGQLDTLEGMVDWFARRTNGSPG